MRLGTTEAFFGFLRPAISSMKGEQEVSEELVQSVVAMGFIPEMARYSVLRLIFRIFQI